MTTTPAAATVDLYTRPHAELANILTEGIPEGDVTGFRFGPDANGRYWLIDHVEYTKSTPGETTWGFGGYYQTRTEPASRRLRVLEAPKVKAS